MDSESSSSDYIQIATELAAIQPQILAPATLSRHRYAELMLQRDKLIKRFWVALLDFGINCADEEAQRQALQQFRGEGPSDGWTKYAPMEPTDEQKLETYERMHEAAVEGRPFDPSGPRCCRNPENA